MRKVNHRVLIALLFDIAVTAGGCSILAPQPDRSRFFVLTPSADSQVAPVALVGSGHSVTIGLGPIAIPRYLQRPEVVTRISQTELSVSDNDRWAEPLGACVASVLAQDLSVDLPGLQIVAFPWSKKNRIAYRVSVEFFHLERTADGKADVQVTWSVRSGLDNKLLQSGTTIAIRAAGADQSSASAALSEGIAQLGREIAEALARQPQLETDTSRQARS
jgi:uncharacterized protein